MQAKSRETHQTRLLAFMELYESIGRRRLLPELYTIIIPHLKVTFSDNFHFFEKFLELLCLSSASMSFCQNDDPVQFSPKEYS